jgi:hypothetical protein
MAAAGRVSAVDLRPGDLLVTEGSPDAVPTVYRVDPVTGERTIVSRTDVLPWCVDRGFGFPFTCCTGFMTGSCPPPVGTGFQGIFTPAGIALEETGDILIGEYNGNGVIRIDPHTGDRTLVAGYDPAVGSASLLFVRQLSVESDGNVLVIYANALLRVYPASGDRAIVSSFMVGSGPRILDPHSIGLSKGGDALVGQGVLDSAVLRIDPRTGARSVVSGEVEGADCGYCPRGTGPPLTVINGIVADETDDILVADRFTVSLQRVEPMTGNRSIVSSSDQTPNCTSSRSPFNCCTGAGTSNGVLPCAPSVGAGPGMRYPQGIALEWDGHIVAVDERARAIFRIDPVSGDREIVSGCEIPSLCGLGAPVGQGPPLRLPDDIVVVPGIPDSDRDGILEDSDVCSGTPSGEIVNADGCSISQLVPCAATKTGDPWKSHGRYLSATRDATRDFLDAGLISELQRKAILKAAIHSDCGR